MPDRLGSIWSILFKINMAVLPLCIIWGAWITTSIIKLEEWKNQGDRFTAADGMVLELQMKEWVRSNYPPEELREDLKAIHDQLEAITIELAKQGIDIK